MSNPIITLTLGVWADISAIAPEFRTLFLKGTTGDQVLIETAPLPDGTNAAPYKSTGMISGQAVKATLPSEGANGVRITRTAGASAVVAYMVGSPVLTGGAGPAARPSYDFLDEVEVGKAHVFDVLDNPFVVGGGFFVAGEDGVTADGTNNTTVTITARDSAGTSLGTVGTFVLNTNRTVGQRVAFTLGSLVNLPSGASLFWEASNAGTGAVIGSGASFELTS